MPASYVLLFSCFFYLFRAHRARLFGRCNPVDFQRASDTVEKRTIAQVGLSAAVMKSHTCSAVWESVAH